MAARCSAPSCRGARTGWCRCETRALASRPSSRAACSPPFQRLHDHSHPAIAGIGLGLALVQTVVLRHGGTLEVESDVGRGAEFRLVLPQQLDAPSDDDDA